MVFEKNRLIPSVHVLLILGFLLGAGIRIQYYGCSSDAHTPKKWVGVLSRAVMAHELGLKIADLNT